LVERGAETFRTRRGGTARPVRLTRAGWRVLAESQPPAPAEIVTAADALMALIRRLRQFLAAQNLDPLCFMDRGPEAVFVRAEDEFTAAYLRLTGGRNNVRVRLARLRSELGNLDPNHFENRLIELQRQGIAALYALDDPLDIGPEDERAAVMVGGRPRHLVYMKVEG
jgi:hypothetical protein